MGSNRLRFNLDQTQVIWLGMRQRLATVDTIPIRLHDGIVIAPSIRVHNLGLIFDGELSVAKHVSSVTRVCFYDLHQLGFMRHPFLPDDSKMLVHAFIFSWVDYCNSLLYSPQLMLSIDGIFGHITSALRDDLHWLPMPQCIEYKVL